MSYDLGQTALVQVRFSDPVRFIFVDLCTCDLLAHVC
jgi:hypothetical protein